MASTSSTENDSLLGSAGLLDVSAGAFWHKSAPKALRRAFSADGSRESGIRKSWGVWQEHLAARRPIADLVELMPGRSEPLGWGLPDGIQHAPRPAWLERAERAEAQQQSPDPALEKEILGWMGESAGSGPDVEHALEILSCAWAIDHLAAVLSSEAWWAVLDHLFSVVADAGAIDLSGDPLVHQLLAGELAMTLAYRFPEISPCRKLKSAGRRALSQGPSELLDGDGAPDGRHMALLRPLLACWTRCWALGERLGRGCFRSAPLNQYEWFVRQALRLARHDGTHVFGNGLFDRWDSDLFRAALWFGGDGDDGEIAALVLPGGKAGGKCAADPAELPSAATHSEWASVAVLRPKWSRSGERLTAVYADGLVSVELGCGKDVLFSGPWQLNVRRDGKAVMPVSDWKDVCWISDEDVDFLELEIELDGDLRVQRTMLLARKDRFLLLADAVLGNEPAKLEYLGVLPLQPGISFDGADESREGFLVGGKRRALVLPLALPEWRSDRRVGELAQSADGLQLSQSAGGCCLYAPLLMDLDRRRQTRLYWEVE